MKKEVIIVPKDKCPLDVLAEMGKQTKNSWIYLHKTAIDKLMNKEHSATPNFIFYELTLKETENHPKTTIRIDGFNVGVWFRIIGISANDITFKEQSIDPEDIFFLKMEE